jgi:hypothetical protein
MDEPGGKSDIGRENVHVKSRLLLKLSKEA